MVGLRRGESGLSARDERVLDLLVFAALQAGARGYLLKGAEQEDIARAVRAMHAGGVAFGPGGGRRILQQ